MFQLPEIKHGKMRLSLAQQGLILIAVPPLFVLVLMGYLGYLHNEAEAQATRVEHAKDISDAVNQLERDIFEIVSGAGGNDEDERLFFEGQFDGVIADIGQQLQHLVTLVKGDPRKEKIFADSYRAGQTAMRILAETRVNYRRGLFKPKTELRSNTLKELRGCVHLMVSQEMLDLAREEKLTAREGPEVAQHFRKLVQTILVSGALFVIVVTIGIYIFYIRRVVRRLNIMLDNNMRLACGAELNPVIPGDDEIADLDKAFHAMASSLAEATEKERAAIANAKDVIYSLDERGTFISVNAASSTVFGYTPAELIGSRFINMAVPDALPDVVNAIKIVTEGGREPPFEMRLKRKDGRIIDVQWSAQWSEKDRAIFCVAHDITERKQAERLRTEVVQMVSHDLKTPLSTVRSFLDMLEAGVCGELSERGTHLLHLADSSTSRMLTLIKDLLDIEKMEAGMLQLNKSQVALAPLVEQVAGGVSATASERGVRIQMEPCNITVYADPDRINQVLTNLVSNAIKFSPRGEGVTIKATEKEETVEINVIDHGRGIPASMQATIFDRFRQVRVDDATEKGGSGLGLAICQALVVLHAGTISVASQEGQGSTFTVSLPKLEQEPSEEVSEPSQMAEPPALAS